ncbi:caldesmon isoform X1 [Cygnus atratus]|uniref:caldesmon isoform X1 n=1 Tax=Cygnus atratus TaxID=8868 RepID=UPI0015D63E32|nr:caldesmon isoform X1 [Cygnus atratus]XP_035406611.1 caldesmon isoform X1 [Cygnus atratus]XP_035406612.1 caldesmon isoform X1 [Cygnus atratus]XP_035406614.1 caldesmon isoform X1 [Cygnus atratus]XP_035406619.1 caldesmon isoform X1 [Cygnus atratus]XP_035406620.1 caldesmon isoform X1 [Cygnus atratus]XP_035406621.1 caldesmon isoform X1 [Cygnus atratus]XP_035406622.1 caldesmon isoform X1 [Cygnus atratus]XP_035406623.1 caldesmon isoform X1 [Cygnus atratus]XP_050566779.1 caldesmon isoform X1 [C
MDDFERRRELRRQKREEMRLEAERLSYQRNDDDDEEAARERRRRARQERLRQKEEEDLSGDVTEKSEVNAQNSVAEDETKRTTTRGTDDEAALLERLARREERRQKRLQEALERQKEFDPTITDGSLSVPSRREVNNVEENETTGKEEKVETRQGRYETEETETVTKSYQRNNWRQDGEEDEKKEEKDKEEAQEDKPKEVPIEENQVKDKDKEKAPKEEMKSVWDRKKGVPEQKAQNGERELTSPKLKSTENAFGRSNLKGIANAEEAKAGSQVEAGKRLDDLRRRQGENEKEDFEKLKEKQQEAAVELEELKKRREERRKILEEEEQKKKQEEAERKAREEEEKRRMKEEIERRRAEAAEKRQKMPEDGVSEEKKPFKCFSPKGSSLKIEERAEFLNKSAQKSGMKPTQTTAVVSKIDSRLEQYTSAVVGTKAAKPAKPAASDLPVPAEGVRNIKSMWEKGNVFSSPSGGTGASNKETAGLKVGVSSRINEWLTKTPESNKSPAPKPSDLRPGDVSGKRNLWEKQSVDKPAASSSKVTAAGKKSETNAGLRQLEKEP